MLCALLVWLHGQLSRPIALLSAELSRDSSADSSARSGQPPVVICRDCMQLSLSCPAVVLSCRRAVALLSWSCPGLSDDAPTHSSLIYERRERAQAAERPLLGLGCAVSSSSGDNHPGRSNWGRCLQRRAAAGAEVRSRRTEAGSDC